MAAKTVADVMKMVKENEVKFVDFRFSDTRGKEQHVTVPVSHLDDDKFTSGHAFDGSSIAGWKGIEASDMLLMPDPNTANIDPFYEETTLFMSCDVLDPTDGKAYDRDPRSIARRAEAYLKASGLGDTAYFGPEPEFFIFDDVRWGNEMSGSFFHIDEYEAPWNSGKKIEGGNKGHRPTVKGGYFPVPPVDSTQDMRAEMSLILESLGIPRAKIRVVLNAIEPPKVTRARADVRAELGLAENQVAIGFVGRLGRHKAIDVMVPAFARVLAKHPDTRLIVIGDGEGRDEAHQQARDLGCDSAIAWLGARDSLGYYSGFDLLALPSRYEGLSYSMLEAGAVGLPVVATDVSGTRDALVDGENGLIVSRVGDVDAFAAALETIVGNPAIRAKLARGAASRIETGDIGRMVAGMLAVYAGGRTKD